MDPIRIKTLTSDDEEQVFQFLVEEFAPDEPTMSSLGILLGKGLLDQVIYKHFSKKFVRPALRSGHSFAAWDEVGNLVGVKLGKILKSDEEPEK